MKALTVRQPWAHLIVRGIKRVEIRRWATDYRGPILVHAGKAIDPKASRRFRLEGLPLGALVGSVSLDEIEPFTPERWLALAEEHMDAGPFQPGLYAWHLARPRPFRNPVPWTGQLGLFDVDLAADALESLGLGRRHEQGSLFDLAPTR